MTGHNANYGQFLILATDSLGQLLWSGTYAMYGEGSSIRPASGEGHIATGTASRHDEDPFHVHLVRLDSRGRYLWSASIGGDSETSSGCAGQQTADSGFMVLGSTASRGAGGTDVWLIRLEPEQIGVAEMTKPEVRMTYSGATVIRGVLFLAARTSSSPSTSCLLDACGRKALDLRPGANDVRALAPGVYFVREAQAQAVRKVVVTR